MSNKWDDTVYVKAYELAAAGESDAAIARACGVSGLTFAAWKKRRPALRDALERARAPGAPAQQTFRDYVYGALPQHLKELWDRLNACEGHGAARVEHLLSPHGKAARQHLFLYALVHCDFDPSEACRRVNVSARTLEGWRRHDPEFAELCDEIHWHKGNFFEAALVARVREGDPACTIFANKTFNRARGYQDRVKVEQSGKVEHEHTHAHALVPLDRLDLPLDVLRMIVERCDNLGQEQPPPALPPPRTVEGTVYGLKEEAPGGPAGGAAGAAPAPQPGPD